MGQYHGRGILFLKDEIAGKQPVSYAAQPVEIGACIHRRTAHRHFGSHERGRSGGGAIGGHLRFFLIQILNQTEIENFYKIVFIPETAHEDIGGFDVAMDEAMMVGVREERHTCCKMFTTRAGG